MPPTSISDTSYDIHDLPVILTGGPDDGDTLTANVIRILDGKRAVMSRHSEGYYCLPDDGARDHDSGLLLASWEPHPDARFPWSRTA
jgi:hypothetical protein